MAAFLNFFHVYHVFFTYSWLQLFASDHICLIFLMLFFLRVSITKAIYRANTFVYPKFFAYSVFFLKKTCVPAVSPPFVMSFRCRMFECYHFFWQSNPIGGHTVWCQVAHPPNCKHFSAEITSTRSTGTTHRTEDA